MAAQRRQTATAESPSLKVLGISEAEERCYRWLLSHPGATAAEVARGLSLTSGKSHHLLDSIETKGLTTQSPERPHRYIPVSPNIALKALSLRRYEELRFAEGITKELQEVAEEHRQGKRDPMVELLTTREMAQQVYMQMVKAAVNEVVVFVKLPMYITNPGRPEDYEPQALARARGVRSRTINDAEFLDSPGAATGLSEEIKSGEEARFFPSLPFKMMLIDHRIGLVPLNPQQETGPSLLLRKSALLDALYALFEVLWERSLPITIGRDDVLEGGNSKSRLPDKTEELLLLMAAGLNDKKIAAELGIHISTLKRYISQIMQTFNVRTRFQLGRITGDPTIKRYQETSRQLLPQSLNDRHPEP